jgi:PAS domain S-box-containing protein
VPEDELRQDGTVTGPEPITERLLAVMASERSPAYLGVDARGVLRELGGPLRDYGLGRLELGSSAAGQVFFLEGLLPLEGPAIFLPCLKTEEGLTADVHIFKDGSLDWVLFLSAASNEIRAHFQQQRVNEASLDRERDRRVLRAECARSTRDLLDALELALFERAGASTFVPIGGPSEWLVRIWPQLRSGPFRPGPENDFLINFLVDAEAFWASDAAGQLRSGIWSQDVEGVEVFLQAAAVRTPSSKILLIEQLRTEYDEQHSIIQEARERGLDHSRWERLEQALRLDRDELRTRVEERTAELVRLNQILQWELSERLRAERHAHLLLQGVQSTTEMITVVDGEQRVGFANRALMEAIGQSNDVKGQLLAAVWPDAAGNQHILATLRGPEGRTWQGQLDQRRTDGTTFPVMMTISPVKDEAGITTGHILVGRNQEEQRKAEEALRLSEEELRQSKKMEAIGRLAGGVAHDFNNLLTVIIGYSDHLLKSLDAHALGRAELEGIFSAGERAASLTQQLLAFSRKQILRPQVIDLQATLAETEKLLRRVVGEDIDLQTRTDPSLGRVVADVGQLQQVLLNLVVNARDAMPNGGRLTLECMNVTLDEAFAGAHLGVDPGRYVMLAVSDTGCGISKEIQTQIFEPFFTTKPQGTGLGLATVYGIVKQTGGSVFVDSESGKGTRFTIYLPMAVGDEVQAPLPAAPATGTRGSETILVAEDESMIGELIVSVLESNGHKVFLAHDMEEALRIVDGLREPLHLLLTDVVMRGGTGVALAAAVVERMPQIRLLFMSGYAERVDGMLKDGAAFLQKPFSSSRLVQKVREVFDEA